MRLTFMVIFATAVVTACSNANDAAEPASDPAYGNQPAFDATYANQLLAACSGNEDKAALSLCRGFIQGVIQTKGTLDGGLLRQSAYCLRDEVTHDQVRDVVIHYLRKNPKLRDLPSDQIVIIALVDAFPC